MNNSSTFATTLHEANLAAKQRNWFQVQCYLQHLSRSQPLEYLAADIWQEAFNLALEVLFQGDFPEKWGITKFIPLLGQQIVVPLIAILEDENIDPEIHWFVVKILGKFREPRVVIALAQLLQTTQEEDLASIAAQTLAHIGKPAIEALTNLLKSAKHRLFAVISLAHIRTVETIPPLLQASHDPQPEIRAISLEALGSFHLDPIPLRLITALKDPSSLVRKEAVTALGFRRDMATELNLIEHLQPLLHDLNGSVCQQTAIALGRMHHDQSATVLFEVLQSPHTPLDLKLVIVRALGWSEIGLALNYLEKALPEAEPLVCQEIMMILGRILTSDLKTQATKILLDFATAYPEKLQQYQLKTHLATSLGELGKPIAQKTLKQLEQDLEPRVRLHAIAALRKLP